MGGSNAGYGQAGGAYGVNCGPTGAGFQQVGGAYGAGGACGPAGGYGVAGNGYGGAGYGAAGYGQGAGAGFGAGAGAGYGAAGYGGQAGGAYGAPGYGAGAAGFGGAGYGATGYGAGGLGGVGAGLAANGVGGGFGANGYGVQGFNGAYGANGAVTTLGANAAYGSAAYGQNVVGTQYANGQYVQGAGVQTIQGAPYYVPQPYPAYYGVPQLRGVGAALPFGIEAGIGTEFDIGGNIFGGKDAGPASDGFGGVSAGRDVSAIPSISYNDAFDEGVNYDLATTYDISRNTTVLGRVGYSERNGQNINIGSVTEGGATEDLFAEFSDLEQYRVEGGVRQYVGGFNNGFSGLRPYVGATAGFTYTDDVDVTQSSAAFAGGPETQQYIDGGWNPTASGLIGAEYQVGGRTAIGIETGIRWSDNLDTALPSQDRWSIPVSLRGRVSF